MTNLRLFIPNVICLVFQKLKNAIILTGRRRLIIRIKRKLKAKF